jgi:hypothetical protein
VAGQVLSNRQFKRQRRENKITLAMTPEAMAAQREQRLADQDAKRQANKQALAEQPANDGQAETLQAANDRKVRARTLCYDLMVQRGTITPGQHKAGDKSVELWAQANGLDARHERLLERIDSVRRDASSMTDKRIDAQLQWNRLLGDIGATSGRLMFEIADDWICDRGEDWRAIVRRVYIREVDTNENRERTVLGALVMSALENARAHFDY